MYTQLSHHIQSCQRYLWLIPLFIALLAAPSSLHATIPDYVTAPHTGPDLIVTEIRIDPPNPQPGDIADINVTIKNVGDETAPAGFRIYLYVDPEDDPPTASTQSTTRLFRGQAMDPGETFSFARTEHEFTTSNPVIYAWVDPIWENNVVETDDNNNQLRFPENPGGSDDYELDNDCSQAKPLTVNASPQSHNLIPTAGLTSDADWIKFDSVRGTTYTVNINAVGDDADLYAEYYGFCNDRPSLSGSGLSFTIESDKTGPYYLKIGHTQPTYGPDTRYTVEVITDITPTPSLPPEDSEPNNSCANAATVPVDGTAQEHNLTPDTGSTTDIDWIQFETVRGQFYNVDIRPIGEDADLYGEYYDFCAGASPLSGGINFTILSAHNGPYYVSISHSQPPYGPDTRYSVQVTTGTVIDAEPTTPTPTSTPSPTATRTEVSTATRTPTMTSTPTTMPTSTSTPVPSNATWTLFIYAMGDNDLYRYLGIGNDSMLSRLRQLRGQAEPGVQLALLLDGSGVGDSYYYTLSESGLWDKHAQKENSSELRMDDDDTLEEFLAWGFEHYGESDYYALSILGHASGVMGMGPDDSSSTASDLGLLEPQEIRNAIRATEDFLHLDVVQFDGCSFGLFENTSIVEGLADYVIASPNTGWGIFAYDIYRGLAGSSVMPAEYARNVADYYAKRLREDQYPYTISVFDMTYYSDVQDATDQLGSALDSYISGQDTATRQGKILAKRAETQIYDSGNYRLDHQEDTYVDLKGFATALTTVSDGEVAGAAQRVIASTKDFILYERSESGMFVQEGEVIEQNLDNVHGLAIFYPYSGDDGGMALEHYYSHELFRNLTTDWGWVDFLLEVAPTPIERTDTLDINMLAPLINGFYQHYSYLPVVMR